MTLLCYYSLYVLYVHVHSILTWYCCMGNDYLQNANEQIVQTTQINNTCCFQA